MCVETFCGEAFGILMIKKWLCFVIFRLNYILFFFSVLKEDLKFTLCPVEQEAPGITVQMLFFVRNSHFLCLFTLLISTFESLISKVEQVDFVEKIC